MLMLTDERLQEIVLRSDLSYAVLGSDFHGEVAVIGRELLAYREVTAHWPGGVGLAVQRAVRKRVGGEDAPPAAAGGP